MVRANCTQTLSSSLLLKTVYVKTTLKFEGLKQNVVYLVNIVSVNLLLHSFLWFASAQVN